jgi:hypothetical protein
MSNHKMIQSGSMRDFLAIPILLMAALPAGARDHEPPPVRPAQSYAAVEVHPLEQVAIAAEPYDTKEKESIFRFDFLKHGFMPVLLTVTNMGSKPISLNDARILFETASGATVQAAEPEDVERTMTRAQRQGRNIPIPAPLPGIHLKSKGKFQEVQNDFDTFEYKSIVVDPHSTQAGFLFYDVGGLTHPLQGAHLYIREIRNADGKQLFYFEVPFDKYLQSKSGKMH